jgi:hypothetical protein
MITKDKIVLLLQTLVDLNAIEHVNEKDRKFTDDSSLFRFTSSMVNGTNDQEFVSKISKNFVLLEIL